MIKQALNTIFPPLQFIHQTPALVALFFSIIGIIIGRHSTELNSSIFAVVIATTIAVAIHKNNKILFILVGYVAFSSYSTSYRKTVESQISKSTNYTIQFHSSPRYRTNAGYVQIVQLLRNHSTIIVDVEMDRPILPGENIEAVGSFSPFSSQAKPWSKSDREKGFVRGVHGQFVIDSITKRYSENAILFRLAHSFNTTTNKYPSTIAPMLKALFRADQSEIQPGIKELFRRSGISHLLAMSGQHVATIVAILILLLKPLPIPPHLRAVVTILIPWSLLFFTGPASSIVRSLLMSSILLSGFFAKRKVSALNTLGFAGIVLLIISPTQLFSPGFLLSFSAVGAILLTIATLETSDISGNLKKAALFVLVPISAGLATTPITVAFFGTTAPIGIIANIILTPLFSLLFIATIPLLFISIFTDWPEVVINTIFTSFYDLTQQIIVLCNLPLTEQAYLTPAIIIIPCCTMLFFATEKKYRVILLCYTFIFTTTLYLFLKPLDFFEWKDSTCAIKRTQSADVLLISDNKIITPDFLRWLNKDSKDRTAVLQLNNKQKRSHLYSISQNTEYRKIYVIEDTICKEQLPPKCEAISPSDTLTMNGNAVFPF